MKRTVTMLVCLFVMLCLVSTTWAATYWSDGGSDHLWSNPDNWTAASSNSPPAAVDSTYIRFSDMISGGQGPLIQDGIDAVARNLSVEVGSGSLIEMAMTGGTLTLHNPGSTNCYFRFGAGTSSGTAVFNMSGGVLTVNQDDGGNGYVRVGYGYRGEMYMSNDATVYALDLLIGSDNGSIVDLRDNAQIILDGDETGDIFGFVDVGILTGYGSSDLIRYSYDEGTDLTTIWTVPEPGTLVLLSLGCALLRRKH